MDRESYTQEVLTQWKFCCALHLQLLNKIPNFDMLCPVQDSRIMASNNECVTKSTSHANVGYANNQQH